MSQAAPVFAALGEPTRLNIVGQLCSRGPQSIVRLTQGTSVSRQAITKHLHALGQAGLVRSTREGRERIWEIRTKGLADARLYLAQIAAQWDAALERLRVAVEIDDVPAAPAQNAAQLKRLRG
ncbi:MAG TPA: metalloregulator ArsR/SmtB family transcription factor [Steroidobacteraceae bacterium]|nr:metalloregulator ArsR/SmtB family transcription factor [Steroidobacteraceae bacterium]